MPKYVIKLKRKAAPVIQLTLDSSGKLSFNTDGTYFLAFSTSCDVIAAIVRMIAAEGLEWIRVDEQEG